MGSADRSYEEIEHEAYASADRSHQHKIDLLKAEHQAQIDFLQQEIKRLRRQIKELKVSKK